MTLLLTNDDVAELLPMADLIAGFDAAYRRLADGHGTSRPRSDCYAPTERADALYALKSVDGIAPDLGVAAARLTSDIVTWPTRAGEVRREKVPSAGGGRSVGLVVLFSTTTGEPLAVLPDGTLQRLRVGATSALAARYLARTGARRAAVIGCGRQAGLQLVGLATVRSLEHVRCFSPTEARRCDFAARWTERLGLPVEPAASAEEAVRNADVVLCATNGLGAVLPADLIEPGMHLSSIRAREIDANAVARADRVVVHTREAAPTRWTATGAEPPGPPPGAGAGSGGADVDHDAFPPLADVVSGAVAGRQADDEVTCFLNTIGTGFQYAVAGALVNERAAARGVGRDLPTEWFTQERA